MKKTFVSYDAERHGNYKQLIKAWASTDQHFIFNDNSIDTSVNSTNADYIKTRIRKNIDDADIFVVIVGDYASSNKWVDWECDVARSLFKDIKVIRVESYFKIPNSIDGYYNMTVYDGFTKENLYKALNY